MRIVATTPELSQGLTHQIAPVQVLLSAVTGTVKVVQRPAPATVAVTVALNMSKFLRVPAASLSLAGVAPGIKGTSRVPKVTLPIYPTWPTQRLHTKYVIPPAVIGTGAVSPKAVDILIFDPIRFDIDVETAASVGLSTNFAPINFDIGVRSAILLLNADEPISHQYRVVITDMGGLMLDELDNAVPGTVKWAVGDMDSFEFNMPMGDPKAKWCQALESEVQVYRGNRLLFWGPIIRTKEDGAFLKVQCQDPSFYFTRRVFGMVPKQNILDKSFEGGPATNAGWEYTSLPRSSPRRPPAHSYSFEIRYNEHRSMYLSSSVGRTTRTYSNDAMFNGTALTSAGRAYLNAAMADTLGPNPRFNVHVYDDNATRRKDSLKRARARCDAIADYILTQMPDATVITNPDAWRHPVKKNSTAANRKENRRTTVTYRDDDGKKGAKQCAQQRIRVDNPKPRDRKRKYTLSGYLYVENAAGYAAGNAGLELVRSNPSVKHPDPKWRKDGYKKPLQTAMVPIGKGTPKQAWVRMEASVTVPNDGKKSILYARLYVPNGDVYWSEVWLSYDESLYFKDREQGDIIRAIIEHSQDEELGKSDLNIKTAIKDTGVPRSREYLYTDRTTIYDALAEWLTLADGVEWNIAVTPTRRTFTTYYPRKGRDTDVVLANDSNIAGYTIDLDGTQISTTVIMLADGEGADREERSIQDPTLMNGLVLEKAYSITPNSPASSWARQAQRGLARYRRPVVIPSVNLHPDHTDELLDSVEVGDRVKTMIHDEWIDTAQKYRVTEMTLDPATDALTYSLYPEDIKLTWRLNYGWGGWKYRTAKQTRKRPYEGDTSFADYDFDDSAWAEGQAGIGWVRDATGNVLRLPAHDPTTVVSTGHEVWARRKFHCDADAVMAVRASDWAYVYVNGHRIDGNRGDYFGGYNYNTLGTSLRWVVPSEYLNESGVQVVAVHAGYDAERYSTNELDSVYVDVRVLGSYNKDLIL